MMLDGIDVPPLQIREVEPEHLVGDMIQPGHPLFGLVWINLERVSGTPCFYGTRLPVASLFHYLGGGETIDDFIDAFGGVNRDPVLGVLNLAARGLLAELNGIEDLARSQRDAARAAALVGA